jgi:hypothetical protein
LQAKELPKVQNVFLFEWQKTWIQMAEVPSIDKKHDSSVPRFHTNGRRSLQLTQKNSIFCAEMMLSNTKQKTFCLSHANTISLLTS